MIDLRIVATRQYSACFLVMLASGALLIGTTQFLPQLAQQNFAYTATWAGLVLSPGGLVTMVMMFVAGRLVGKVQPKYLIVAGAVIIALSLYALTNVYGDLEENAIELRMRATRRLAELIAAQKQTVGLATGGEHGGRGA